MYIHIKFNGLHSDTHPLSQLFQRDAALEQKVVNWISSVIDERPSADYEHFIQDGSVLSRYATNCLKIA